uniref:Uncharacterized protein n=1 Tax=viral metagenome TaxID=1070528 RepID=A0A6M3KBX8_9ZZZZ
MPDKVKLITDAVTGKLMTKKKADGTPLCKLVVGGKNWWFAEADGETSLAQAWRLCKTIERGETAEIGYTESVKGDRTYENPVSLNVVSPRESPEPEMGQTKAEESTYWEAKGKREDMRSALHAAVQFAEGKDIKGEDVVRVAEVFYKSIREAE